MSDRQARAERRTATRRAQGCRCTAGPTLIAAFRPQHPGGDAELHTLTAVHSSRDGCRLGTVDLPPATLTHPPSTTDPP